MSSTSLPKSPPSRPRTAIPQSKGIPGLRKAQAAYYQRRFGVELDPDKRSHRHARVARKGSPTSPRRSPRRAMSCWRPTPAIRSTTSASSSPAPRSARSRPRPATTSSTGWSGRCATPCRGPRCWSSAIRPTRPRYVADLAFYERLVAFAREHELIVISDLAYAEIYFGDTPTPSILQVEGAKEVAVEFTSMSKTYSHGRLADGLRGRQRSG